MGNTSVAVGTFLSAPGFKNGVFGRSTLVAGSAPSCFEEAAVSFGGEDRLFYALGDRVSGKAKQRFNPYQGIIRFIYEPYSDSNYSKTRTIFCLEGKDGREYIKVYVSDGVFYLEIKGLSGTEGSVTRQATANWPGSFTIGNTIHVVCVWDFFGRAAGGNYLEIYIDGSAGTPYTSFIPLLGWSDSGENKFVLGNNYTGTECCNGKICGFMIKDKILSSSEVTTDYNSGSYKRLIYQCDQNTLFAFPFDRESTTSDYDAYGVDKSPAWEIGDPYDPGNSLIYFQNPNGNIIEDGDMDEPNVIKWSEGTGASIGKESSPSYTRNGRYSLKVTKSSSIANYGYQNFAVDNNGPVCVFGNMYVPTDSYGRVLIMDGGSNTVYDSGEITDTGWTTVRGAGEVQSGNGGVLYLYGGGTGGVAYFDEVEIKNNWIRNGGMTVGDPPSLWDAVSGAVRDRVNYGGGLRMLMQDARYTVGHFRYIRQQDKVAAKGRQYLFMGYTKEWLYSGVSIRPMFFLRNGANNYLYHNFDEVGAAGDEDWHEFCYTVKAEASTIYKGFGYFLTTSSQTNFIDDVIMLEMDTISPQTYFSGTSDYYFDKYETDTGSMLIDGRDVARYNISPSFFDTSSGGLLIQFKSNGSWFYDDEEHVFMSYGSDGTISLKKNTSNEIELSYGDATCTLGVGSLSPTGFNKVGASWDQTGSKLSLMAGGIYNEYSGLVTAVGSSPYLYFGNEATQTGDKAVNAYYDKVHMYSTYVTTTSWGLIHDEEIFT